MSGCDTVIDCLDDDGPRFPSVTLEPAILNQVYSETVRVSINNEPRDDNFSYDFEISGALPEGISTASSGRDFIFSGTPIESGSFVFTLFVEIQDEFDFAESGLCFYSDSRRYELTVNEI
jgi:hypothetical protein